MFCPSLSSQSICRFVSFTSLKTLDSCPDMCDIISRFIISKSWKGRCQSFCHHGHFGIFGLHFLLQKAPSKAYPKSTLLVGINMEAEDANLEKVFLTFGIPSFHGAGPRGKMEKCHQSVAQIIGGHWDSGFWEPEIVRFAWPVLSL